MSLMRRALVAQVIHYIFVGVVGALFGYLAATATPGLMLRTAKAVALVIFRKINTFVFAAGVARFLVIAQCALLVWVAARKFLRKKAGVRNHCGVRQILSYPAIVDLDGAESDGSECDDSRSSTDEGVLGGWYVGENDLAFFKSRAEERVELPGATQFQQICHKEVENEVQFWGTRRTLANGKTEYLHTTVLADATAREVADFYLDDPTRPAWDGFITKYQVVENGNFAKREQVVRYLRSFPFGFISDREYIIGRREYADGDKIYCVSRGIQHKQAPVIPGLVRTDVYWSMWSCENIPCPWGSDKPACRVTLLHHEQMMIPENLARFAIKQGMWGLVRKIAPTFAEFSKERRGRVGSHEVDPNAYGSDSSMSNMYAAPCGAAASSAHATRGIGELGPATYGNKRRLRKLASMVVLASGVVLAMNSGSTSSGGRKEQQKRRKYARSGLPARV